jgi:cysteine synthase
MWSTPGSAPVTASIPDTIGDTPLVRLRRVVPDGAAHVFVKVEGGNPTGSYKVGYAGLGREILAQTRDSGTGVDAFRASVGTAGMVVGVANVLRSGGSAARVVALEPATSPMLTAGLPDRTVSR